VEEEDLRWRKIEQNVEERRVMGALLCHKRHDLLPLQTHVFM
jgi:hypothetical protein